MLFAKGWLERSALAIDPKCSARPATHPGFCEDGFLPTLLQLAARFHQRLQSIKQATPLESGQAWYPWHSLSGIEVLEKFIGSDVKALRKLMGAQPVLEVGCGDGDFSFFLESLGARVDAVDQAASNYNLMTGVSALKQRLESSVRIHAIDMDSRPHLPEPRYGLTLMLGVLYHLKNPFLALETLARHSRYIFLSTRIAAKTPDGEADFSAQPMAYLVGEEELNQDATNFWIFSEAGLKRVMDRSGWTVRNFLTVGDAASSDPVHSERDARAYVLAESRIAPPVREFHLLNGWHELEHDMWRWTARVFSVRMQVPEARAAATLRFRFHLPQELLARRPAVVLQARINGSNLPAATFSSMGEHEYSSVLPPLESGVAEIEFKLDRGLGPTDDDRRELGVLVNFASAPPFEIE